jgi:hypothetical protein
MTTNSLIERLERRQPEAVPALPVLDNAPPFASTISRLPNSERSLPENGTSRFAGTDWEMVAAGILAGFGGGIVWAFILSTILL